MNPIAVILMGRQPTIQQANAIDAIMAQFPQHTAINPFDPRVELRYLAQGYSMWWSTFAPEWEITRAFLNAGLIEWISDSHIAITDAGREALKSS